MYNFGDWVKETTATTGTGTITLTQETGFSRFSDVFSESELVYYTIVDGDNRETGIGTVGAGNTLARTTPQVTLVSGVFDNTSPTPITLSGNAEVFCSLTATAANTIVDTTGTQTLTNKTLDSLTNHIHANAVHKKVENVDSVTLTVGMPVRFSDYDIINERTEVLRADNTLNVAIGVVSEADITAGSEGTVTVTGIVTGVNTNGFTEGSILYPSTAGTWTDTKPATGYAQQVALVIKEHATDGVLQVNATSALQNASEVNYTNTTSGLTATTVQGAIDEVDGNVDALTHNGFADYVVNEHIDWTTVTDYPTTINTLSPVGYWRFGESAISNGNDTFTGTNGDPASTERWTQTDNTSGSATAVIDNNALKITMPSGTAVSKTRGITSSFGITGDCDYQIDMTDHVRSTNTGTVHTRLTFAPPSGWNDTVYIEFKANNTAQSFFGRCNENGTAIVVNEVARTNLTYGQIRITRVGTTVTAYYSQDLGNNWVQLVTHTSANYAGRVVCQVYSTISGTTLANDVSTTIDNFIVNTGTVYRRVALNEVADGVLGEYNGSPTLESTGLLTNDANKSVALDGTDDYVSFAGLVTELKTHTTGSVAFLISLNNSGDTLYISNTNAGSAGDYLLFAVSEIAMVFNFTPLFGTALTINATVSLSLNTAYHIVFVQDATEGVIMYLDGVKQATSVISGSIAGQWFHSNTPATVFDVGAYRVTSDFFYRSNIDELVIYNTALTAQNVTDLYNVSKGNIINIATAYLDVGTSANQLVQLNGSAQLPAVDGSLLTNIGITDASVTYAKLQNAVSDNVLLGNNNGADSDFEELTAAQVRTIINVEDGATADQTAGEIEAIVNHDNLQGFVGNEHIDWTAPLTYDWVVSSLSPIAYWRLGESSGSTAIDEMGNYNATYTSSPAYSEPSLSVNSSGTSVRFPSDAATLTTSSIDLSIWNSSTNGASLLFLMKPNANGATSYSRFFNLGSTTTAGNSLFCSTGSSNNRMIIQNWGGAQIEIIASADYNVGQTYHIVLTSDNAGTLRAYVDGVKTLEEFGYNPSIVDNYFSLAGDSISPVEYINITFDEVAMFNVALTQEQVTLLYNASQGNVINVATANLDTGTSANQLVQLDGTGKLPAIDGSLLTGITHNGFADYVANEHIDWTTPLTYASEINNLTPVAYYRFGEATGQTIAVDETGNNNATYSGNLTLEASSLLTGDSNKAVLFNGTTGYVEIPFSSGIASQTQGSFSCLFTEDVSGFGSVTLMSISQHDGVSITATRAFFGIDNWSGGTNKLQFGIVNDSNTTLVLVRGSTVVTDGSTHHAVLTSNGSTIKIYLDGVEETLSVDDGANTGQWFVDAGSTNAISIGTFRRTNSYSGAYDDIIDEVSFFNTALTQEQVTALYNASQGNITNIATTNLDVGTSANQLVQLDGTAKLPAVDGSQLTNLPAGGIGEFIDNSIAISHDDTALANDDGTANYNVGIGRNAGNSVTSGAGNTFLGSFAGQYNTIASYNTCIGYGAGYRNQEGGANICVGRNSGYGTALTTYHNNVLIGNFTGQNISTSNGSTAVGTSALSNLTSGSGNVALGNGTGSSVTSGVNNTLLGTDAGDDITTGGYNVFVGYQAGNTLTTESNQLRIKGETNTLIEGDFANQTLQVNGTLTARHGFVYTTSGSTMTHGAEIALDSSGGGFTMTLPATPTAGDWVYLVDVGGALDTDNVTIGRNSTNIMSSATDLILDVAYSKTKLTYLDATRGWIII